MTDEFDDKPCEDCAELEKAFAVLLKKSPRRAFNWAMSKALDIVQGEPVPSGYVAPFVGTIKAVAPHVSDKGKGETEIRLPSGKTARIRPLPVAAVNDMFAASERLTVMENRLEVARFRSRFPVTAVLPPEATQDSPESTQGAPADTSDLEPSEPVTGAMSGFDGEPEGN
jgi:hypothetical protein